MISKAVRITLITASVLVLSSVGWGEACSNATLVGNYGFQVSGVGQSGDPRASSGQFTADGKGNLTGTETAKVAGVVYTNVAVTGTYLIKPNCTGKGTWVPKEGPKATYNFVILSDRKNILIIDTAKLRTQSGYAVAQGTAACSTAGLKGTYGIQLYTVGTNNHASGNGQLFLDGAGNLSGTETVSYNGQILSELSVSGTYAMNADCRGTATLIANGLPTVNLALVVASTGQELVAMETDPNSTLVGSMQIGGSAACSDNTLKGNYGLLVSGTDSGGHLTAASNQIAADGNGILTGTQTLSDNGVITSAVAIAGSYQIDSNCTGSAMITPQGGVASNYGLVVVSGVKPLELIDADAGTNQMGYGEAQGKVTCSAAAVKGVYGLSLNGTPLLLDRVAISGQVKLDGSGNLTGTESASYSGVITSNTPVAGTYMINSDCTGTATLTAKNLPTINLNLTVVNRGAALVAIETDSGTEVSGAFRH
jgi:hypothetical protein